MTSPNDQLGLEGEFPEASLPLLIRRQGMSDWDDGIVRILDRRQLPHREIYMECATPEQVAVAIEEMVIQGAFSISIAAGYGLALTDLGNDDLLKALRASAKRLVATRPTGLALGRMISATRISRTTKI
jgi:methylthioribose-1-phosphate isomerase